MEQANGTRQNRCTQLQLKGVVDNAKAEIAAPAYGMVPEAMISPKSPEVLI